MNLTVIIPNKSNRTFINQVKQLLKTEDELIVFKASSVTFINDLLTFIENSVNENILIINPKDYYPYKYSDFLDGFRKTGTVVDRPSLKNGNSAPSSSSTIKITKNSTILPTRNDKIKNIHEFIRYIYEYQKISTVDFNMRKNIKKDNVKTSKKKNSNPVIDFYARDGRYKDRGPFIQSAHKVNYFKKHIQTINFRFSRNNKSKNEWSHYLFPTEAPENIENYSIGPNIFLNKKLGEKHKQKNVVADSEFMKEYLIDTFDIPEPNISVIPVYVPEIFFNTTLQQNKIITVGLTGYCENSDIKNFSSLFYIASALPNVRFEILTSRLPKSFPSNLSQLKNVNFIKSANDKVPNIMKKWHIYLSMSKRERGPAATQEARTMGIPVITPNHTGYKEFNNCIQLPIEPYKEHSTEDKDLIISAIKHCFGDYDKYLKQCQEDKKYF